jgi:hypothetical protein
MPRRSAARVTLRSSMSAMKTGKRLRSYRISAHALVNDAAVIMPDEYLK